MPIADANIPVGLGGEGLGASLLPLLHCNARGPERAVEAEGREQGRRRPRRKP